MKIDERPFAVGRARSTDRSEISPDEHGVSGDPRRHGRRDGHPEPQTAPERPSSRPRDRVDVSDGVAVFSAALEAARQAPSVRPEVVREMRDLLANGSIGSDLERLANSLIDSVEEMSVRTLRTGRPSGARQVRRY